MPSKKPKSKQPRTQVQEIPRKQKVLAAGDLKKVKGGAPSLPGGTKVKTADKAFDAMSGYIRG